MGGTTTHNCWLGEQSNRLVSDFCLRIPGWKKRESEHDTTETTKIEKHLH